MPGIMFYLNAKTLEVKKWASVSVTPDLTPKQQKLAEEKRTELLRKAIRRNSRRNVGQITCFD